MSMTKAKKKDNEEDIMKKTIEEELAKKSSFDSDKIEVAEASEFDLSKLEGVGKVRMERLNADGINTPMDLVVTGPVKVSDITGMDIPACELLVEKARKFIEDTGVIRKTFQTASQVLEYRERVLKYNRIHTGCHELDNLLGGGIELQALTEFYGVYGSGKTQICHTACVMAQLPKDQGGLGGTVIFIDTENTFRPERIKDIVLSRKIIPVKKQKNKKDPLEPEKPQDMQRFLDNILVARAYNASHQQLILGEVQALLKTEQTAIDKGEKKDSDPRPVLIIVDSITSHFRSEYLGRGKLNTRQLVMSEFVHKLVRIAEVYNVAVIGTNQVTANVGGFGVDVLPVGGNILGHTSTYRIYLKKKGNKTVAKMDDSPEHATNEIVFERTIQGIVDVEA